MEKETGEIGSSQKRGKPSPPHPPPPERAEGQEMRGASLPSPFSIIPVSSPEERSNFMGQSS